MSQSPPNGNAKPPRSTSNPLQQLWRQTQPVLTTATVRSLRGTIWLLEQAATKLEAQPPAVPPTAPASDLPASSADEAVAATEAGTTPPITSTRRPKPPVKSTQPTPFDRIRLVWVWLLKTVRSLLPRSAREKLSDTALSGILIGTVMLLLWINSARKPDEPKVTVASRPAVPTESFPSQPPIEIPDTLPAPAEPTPAEPVPVEPKPFAVAPAEPALIEPAPVEITPAEPAPIEDVPAGPSIEPAPAIVPEPIEPPVALEPEPAIELPAPLEDLDVPAEPEFEPPSIAPAPPIALTPEQALVAAIQAQVADITNQYADGLIQSIQANFRTSRLTVKVDDAWYELRASRQNKLAAEMLDRAQELEFNRLVITDAEGTLLARSPVVGSEMIILQRDRS